MEKWIEEMELLTKHDDRVRRAQRRLEVLQPRFWEIRKGLPEEDRLTLDQYIAACMEREYSCVYAAYQVGWNRRDRLNSSGDA